MLLRRGLPGDPDHARNLLAEAIETSEAAGAPRHADLARERLAAP
jgi:hypothetical protein